MITETRDIFESLEEFIAKKDAAAVGDIVLVLEENGTEKAPYVVAHITGQGECKLVRKNLMSAYRPMKTGTIDLLSWLENDFKNGILKNLPEELHERVKTVTLPSIREVYGCDKVGVRSESEQFEWFKDPINRIAIKDDSESDWYWLRDVVSASLFAYVNTYGHCDPANASTTWIGVRPALVIY
ncbi:MAG: DUF6273 domain-containing protein [Lachnospiraceae bacterium]|nr:DUF6273 domain-containing protein [Lachnospiraceae bacterium]